MCISNQFVFVNYHPTDFPREIVQGAVLELNGRVIGGIRYNVELSGKARVRRK